MVIARGNIGGKPHFSADSKQVYLDFDDGSNAVALDGSGHRQVLQVVGPGWYFAPGSAPVDDLFAYAGLDAPAAGVDPWSQLLAADDPATSALARFWGPAG